MPFGRRVGRPPVIRHERLRRHPVLGWSAVGGLGSDLKDDPETLKILRARLSDPHGKVREAAAIAIRKIEKKVEPKKEP